MMERMEGLDPRELNSWEIAGRAAAARTICCCFGSPLASSSKDFKAWRFFWESRQSPARLGEEFQPPSASGSFRDLGCAPFGALGMLRSSPCRRWLRVVPFPWSHPLFQPKPGNFSVLDLTPCAPHRIQDFLSNLNPTRPGLSQGRENFPSGQPHGAFPLLFFFFFSPSKPEISCSKLSSVSQSSWQGSLDTRRALMEPHFSLSFHPSSSSRFPSDFHDIFPHLSPPKKHQFPAAAAQREPGAGDRSWECCPGFLESFIPGHSRIPLCLSSCFVLVFQPQWSRDCFGWIFSSCFDQTLRIWKHQTWPGFAFNPSQEPGASPRTDGDLSGAGTG